jgi:polysaccharide export outer membrane protein
MFQTEDGSLPALSAEVNAIEKNYVIQPNDFLQVEVYTNSGERLIDPDFQLIKELGLNQNMNQRPTPRYLVQTNGQVRLPMIGSVELAGLTLQQSDSLLQLAYSEFYKDPYVLTRYDNKRVIVLGATGGQVIPILNEQTNMLEVLALAGGIATRGKASNIRLIRGDLSNPQVQVIDLSTIEGMQTASLNVQSGDIIYVEPIRRVLPETIRDIGPLVGVLSNIITLVVVIITVNNNQ